MTPMALIMIAVRVGVALTVVALGLRASTDDALFLFRRPRKLARALLSMNVLMPVFTAAMVALFELRSAVASSLIALSVAPIPPILPRKALRAGGGAAYTIGLLVAAAVLSVVFVPLAVELFGRALGTRATVSVGALVSTITLSVVAPLAAGMVLRRLAPRVAERAAKPISLVGLILLALALVPVLIVSGPAMGSLLGDGTLLALVAFNLVGLGVGHLLGGPEPEERSVLALTTSSRHPGVAFVVASATFSEPKLVLAALLLYLLVNAALSLGYLAWSRRHGAKRVHA